MRQARRREIERLRVRIASDLHDEVGSSLWSITLLTQMLQQQGQMGEEERRDLAEVHRIATQSARSIRDIVWLINPAYDTAQDLVLRMRDYCGTVLRGTEYRLDCAGLDLGQRLSLEFRQNVFLIFKEAVTNVAKHARARRVEIRLCRVGESWHLSVRDDGAGFDPKAGSGGTGLASLALRAREAGGALRIESAPGAGTVVSFERVRERAWRPGW
jgi:signal transduction histidine kinase